MKLHHVDYTAIGVILEFYIFRISMHFYGYWLTYWGKRSYWLMMWYIRISTTFVLVWMLRIFTQHKIKSFIHCWKDMLYCNLTQSVLFNVLFFSILSTGSTMRVALCLLVLLPLVFSASLTKDERFIKDTFEGLSRKTVGTIKYFVLWFTMIDSKWLLLTVNDKN